MTKQYTCPHCSKALIVERYDDGVNVFWCSCGFYSSGMGESILVTIGNAIRDDLDEDINLAESQSKPDSSFDMQDYWKYRTALEMSQHPDVDKAINDETLRIVVLKAHGNLSQDTHLDIYHVLESLGYHYDEDSRQWLKSQE